MTLSCYDKNGPICKYCITGVFTSEDKTTWVYGMPRYTCIHPLEFDEVIDPNKEATCPDRYKNV